MSLVARRIRPFIHYSSSVNILMYAVFKASRVMPFFVVFVTGVVYYRKIKIIIMSIFINASVLVL